ncbi:integrase core domain-containing protein [Sphingomonas phyllosphaerae]|uniref:integrase core domain-containing protein n=1 Tax=Sphingomonas phyllosphaerae TaxID=257003 RepID=UPI003AF4584B
MPLAANSGAASDDQRRGSKFILPTPLCALQPSIPLLTRSALHPCLQRHGISRLPDIEGGKADRRIAWKFLEHLLKAVPYRTHTILTDNGMQFAEQPRNRNTAWSRQMRFDMICEANGIEHRLAKPDHPWTNGRVKRMKRTIKEATAKHFHHESRDQLRTHLADFMAAYNFACRLMTLRAAHILRIHRQDLDGRADRVHRRPDPPHAGTKHLINQTTQNRGHGFPSFCSYYKPLRHPNRYNATTQFYLLCGTLASRCTSLHTPAA